MTLQIEKRYFISRVLIQYLGYFDSFKDECRSIFRRKTRMKIKSLWLLWVLSFLAVPFAVSQTAKTKADETRPSCRKDSKVVVVNEALIPTFIDMLKSSKAPVQLCGAELLAPFGKEAMAALPLLADLKESSTDTSLRTPATKALLHITGQDASDKPSDSDQSADKKKQNDIVGVVMDEQRNAIPNARLTLTGSSGAHPRHVVADSDGNFIIDNVDKGTYEIRASNEGFTDEAQKVSLTDADVPQPSFFLKGDRHPNGGEAWHAVVGYEQAGASSQASRRNIFFDLGVSIPLSIHSPKAADKSPAMLKSDFYRFGPKLRLYGNVRISSVPDSNIDAIGLKQFVTTFGTIVGNMPVSKVAQAFEATTGLEYRLFAMPNRLGCFHGLR